MISDTNDGNWYLLDESIHLIQTEGFLQDQPTPENGTKGSLSVNVASRYFADSLEEITNHESVVENKVFRAASAVSHLDLEINHIGNRLNYLTDQLQRLKKEISYENESTSSVGNSGEQAIQMSSNNDFGTPCLVALSQGVGDSKILQRIKLLKKNLSKRNQKTERAKQRQVELPEVAEMTAPQ